MTDISHFVKGAAFVGASGRFSDVFSSAISLQEQTLSMVATLTLGLYAAGLVALGFTLRDKLHRYLGLGLFAATLGMSVLSTGRGTSAVRMPSRAFSWSTRSSPLPSIRCIA